MITGNTARQGQAMGVPNAVLFRAWDFRAPPPVASEVPTATQDVAARAGGGGLALFL